MAAAVEPDAEVAQSEAAVETDDTISGAEVEPDAGAVPEAAVIRPDAEAAVLEAAVETDDAVSGTEVEPDAGVVP